MSTESLLLSSRSNHVNHKTSTINGHRQERGNLFLKDFLNPFADVRFGLVQLFSALRVTHMKR